MTSRIEAQKKEKVPPLSVEQRVAVLVEDAQKGLFYNQRSKDRFDDKTVKSSFLDKLYSKLSRLEKPFEEEPYVPLWKFEFYKKALTKRIQTRKKQLLEDRPESPEKKFRESSRNDEDDFQSDEVFMDEY